jgi:hypothetical protein
VLYKIIKKMHAILGTTHNQCPKPPQRQEFCSTWQLAPNKCEHVLLILTELLQGSALSYVDLKPHTYIVKDWCLHLNFIPLVHCLKMSMPMPDKKYCRYRSLQYPTCTCTELLIARARFERNLVTYFIIFSLS